MKMKKVWVICLILLLTLSLSFIAGCSSQPKETTAPPAKTDSGAQKTADDKEAVKSLFSKGKEVKEMCYEMHITASGLTVESKTWFKGQKMKTDTLVNGQRAVSIFDMAKGELISYLPEKNMATKMKIDEYQGKDNITPLDYLEELEKSEFQILGTETVNGMECKVISVSDKLGKAKMWISVDYGIVVKMEEEVDGKKTVVEFKNIKIGPGSVPDDTFNLPQGVKVMDINAMMENLPKAP